MTAVNPRVVKAGSRGVGSTTGGDDGAAVFGRHLDLTPLRGRSRGLVRCRFHEDRTGSLSVDLDKGVFHCFGCGAEGGMRDFAERVGERRRGARARRLESPLQEALRWAAQRARREGERAAEWEPWYDCNDFIRRSHRAVDGARATATTLGPDHARTWPLLALAARAECDAVAIEAELDAILASGRLA